MLTRTLGVGLALVALAGCGGSRSPAPPGPTAARSLRVTSSAFSEGGRIPDRYTCHGEGVSPPLSWSGVPADADVALVVDDPDAPHGDYVHWVVTSIGPGDGSVDAGAPPPGAHEVAATGGPGWTAPCPPSGTHHYRFTVYALPHDETFSMQGGTVTDFVAALAHEAIAWGRLTGTVSAQ